MVAAKMLESHPLIKVLYYPGLPSHPDHELAKRVFTSGGARAHASAPCVPRLAPHVPRLPPHVYQGCHPLRPKVTTFSAGGCHPTCTKAAAPCAPRLPPSLLEAAPPTRPKAATFSAGGCPPTFPRPWDERARADLRRDARFHCQGRPRHSTAQSQAHVRAPRARHSGRLARRHRVARRAPGVYVGGARHAHGMRTAYT